jgi:hypothetical protein
LQAQVLGGLVHQRPRCSGVTRRSTT